MSKTFNKFVYMTCKRTSLLFLRYDSTSIYSHRIDSDSNGCWDFNPILNCNMFKFIIFEDGSLYVDKDSTF